VSWVIEVAGTSSVNQRYVGMVPVFWRNAAATGAAASACAQFLAQPLLGSPHQRGFESLIFGG
jgi:hypothetical protein